MISSRSEPGRFIAGAFWAFLSICRYISITDVPNDVLKEPIVHSSNEKSDRFLYLAPSYVFGRHLGFSNCGSLPAKMVASKTWSIERSAPKDRLRNKYKRFNLPMRTNNVIKNRYIR